jgi:hypothetical protein
MAKDFFRMQVDFPDLKRLTKEFERFRPALAKKHIGAAVKRSLEPMEAKLKETTPKGPTGNLRRSIARAVKFYPSGNVVGLVGYRKAGAGKTTDTNGSRKKGKDRAFHAHLVEKGTVDRRTKKSIASSWKTLGKFTIRPVAKRTKRSGMFPVRTTPGYPKAFFKRAPRGQGVFLGSMPVGGHTGVPPLRTAYYLSLSDVRSRLQVELSASIEAASRDLADKFPRKSAAATAPPAAA